MATIHREVPIDCDPDRAWRELRDFGAAARLFPGVLTACHEEAGLRTVTFANGLVLQERLVTRDEARRRLAYAVVGADFSQHSASMQITPSASGSCFIWTSDFLPDDAAPSVEALVDAGCQAIKRVLEDL